MTNPSFFNQILIWPILNVLMFFNNVLSASKIPGAFGWSIIFLTLAIRGVLYPLTKTQLTSAKKMSELKPQLDKLTKKHKGDRQKLQQAQLELYKQHGINPAAGCLPLLLQMPVLIALYRVFWQVLGNGDLSETIENINKVVYFSSLKIKTLDLHFFGLDLVEKPSNWQKAGWWLLLIPVITAGLQWYQTKLLSGHTQVKKAVVPQKKKTAKDPKPDMGQEMQKQMALMAPLMIGFVSFSFPIGLALYWNTFSLFGIIQSRKIGK
ncbi:YidC/Oxa1 family membrane protein insertase [Candidatus Microgenomates bacterium]|nr:YidC/Oxa1 family membrane protein insertase [Candidatus Microgenomates bacterium]